MRERRRAPNLDRIDQPRRIDSHRIIVAKVQVRAGRAGLLSDIGMGIGSGNRGVPKALVEQVKPVIDRPWKHHFYVVQSTRPRIGSRRLVEEDRP